MPFAAGGPTDVMARLIAQKLSENLKQQFYVEDHAGAGGNIGMTLAARAAPDGYTVLVASSSFMVNPSLYETPPYDPYKDFAPVTRAAATPNIIVVHPSIPAKTIKELIDLVKTHPGKFSVANPGVGTTPQLATELLKLTYNLDATAIPFGGSGPEIQSALAAQTPIAFSTLPPTTTKSSPETCADLRSPPPSARRRCPMCRPWRSPISKAKTRNHARHSGAGRHAARHRRSAQPRDRQGDAAPRREDKMPGLGFDVVADKPSEFAAYIKNDINKWAKVIADGKIEKMH